MKQSSGRGLPRARVWRARLLLLLAGLVLAACGNLLPRSWLLGDYSAQQSAMQPGNYTLDTAHSALLFRVGHLGLSQYVGRFNSFNAVLDFDTDGAARAILRAEVDTGSIDVNNAAFAKTLAGPKWLDSEAHPQAVLHVDAAAQRIAPAQEDGRAKALFDFLRAGQSEAGEPATLRLSYPASLILRGIKQPVQLEVLFIGGAQNRLTGRYTLGFAAYTEFSRSAFGIDRFVGPVDDRVTLEMHAEFLRSK